MRPINKGKAPYASISKYGDALPFLEDAIGSYCSYCGLPLDHVPEIEHVVSKSKNRELATVWDNLLLGCKYCNARKSDTVCVENMDAYLWPDKYNTALAYTYEYGIPSIHENALNQVDPSGAAYEKAKNLFDLVKLGNVTDRRTKKRNEAYQTACIAKSRWQKNRFGEMKEQIIDTARYSGFFSVWADVFWDEPEILNALIDVFPGTERTFFDADGHPKPILTREHVAETG